MDLALEMGATVEELSVRMSESELGMWARYAAKKSLPMRRMELYLAQVALCVARSAGAAVSLRDFLFDAPARSQDTSATASAAIGAIAGGVRVIRLGQGRKHG